MKGFKKDGKFRPTGNKSKSSLKKSDIKKRTDNSIDDDRLVQKITHVVDYSNSDKEGNPEERVEKGKIHRAVEGKMLDLESGAMASYERNSEGVLEVSYHSEEDKQKDIDHTMERLESFPQRQKEASLSLEQAKELAMKQDSTKNTMFISPNEGQYFPIEHLRFNDTKVKGIWLLADYLDKDGEYFSSQIIKDDKHWNELIDEGRMIAFNNDGTVDEDFKCRDRSCDNIISDE